MSRHWFYIMLFLVVHLELFYFFTFMKCSSSSGPPPQPPQPTQPPQPPLQPSTMVHQQRPTIIHRTIPATAPVKRPPPTFEESLDFVNAGMQESIYRFDRARNLPVMRLSREERNRDYRLVEAGSWLLSKDLVVAAVVRNAMPGLRTTVESVLQLTQVFKSVTFVLVENDSIDGTREYINQLRMNSSSSSSSTGGKLRVVLLGCGQVNSADPCHVDIKYGSTGRRHAPGHWEQAKRTHEEESTDRGIVMAALRNIYLKYIYDNIRADFLQVVEADITWKKAWNPEAIVQGLYYFKAKPWLDSLCAYTIHLENLHDPCTLVFHHNKYYYANTMEANGGPFTDRLGKNNEIFLKYLRPTVGNRNMPTEPVRVATCFQGVTFFRMASLTEGGNGRLFYRYSDGEWHCEHTTLSRQLRENYVDPQMTLYMKGQDFG